MQILWSFQGLRPLAPTRALRWTCWAHVSDQEKETSTTEGAFHPSGVGTMSRGNSLFGGTSLGPSPRIFKDLGPTRGLPSANWGLRTYMLCMLVRGLALQSQGWGGQVCQSQLSLPSLRGRYTSNEGTLGLPGGTPGPYQGP